MVHIAVIFAGMFIAVIALAFTFQRNLIYFPDQTVWMPADTVAPEMEVVAYRAVDEQSLESWYISAPEGRPTIALFHGNGGNIAYRAGKARALIDAGYGVLLAEYRGYGGNGGSPSETGLMADGEAALAFLKSRGVSGKNLILYGESLGTGVAVGLAVRHEVAAVILESPYTSFPDVAAGAYRFFPARYLVRDRFPSIERVGKIDVPLLIVHGDADRVIPVRFGIELFEAANAQSKIKIVEGAGHNNLFERGGGSAILNFLKQQL